MKILRIPLVIFLVVAVRTFNANAQTETNLHSFGSSPNDGLEVDAGLAKGSDGNFYGTTFAGGIGVGTVFRISPSGTYTTLYSFLSVPNDGKYPEAGLVQGSDGDLYGTTLRGGTNEHGTVFRISSSGSYTSLYSFLSVPGDGYYPFDALVQGSDGSLYGTTEFGGSGGKGTVFRIGPSGTYTQLYSFAGPPRDGADPEVGLVQGSDGSFYGTTYGGGTYNTGTVFRISPSGSYTSLYSFGSSSIDGENPFAMLVQGSDGNFYGTTYYGGTYNTGTVFRISPSGSYTSLYSFAGSPNDGYEPHALVQGSDGSFYGTTLVGGTSTNCGIGVGCGIVFKLTVPLSSPPYPINQITGIQKSGTNLVFTIPSIAGETYQLQCSSSLTATNWVSVTGSFASNSIGSVLTLTNFAGANQPHGFYRFAITP
jgi:uncharacterized repeat protein (TIGR03803 family)